MLRSCTARHIRTAKRSAFEFHSNRELQRRTISHAPAQSLYSTPGSSSSKAPLSLKSYSTTPSQLQNDVTKSPGTPASSKPSSPEPLSPAYVSAVKVLATLLGYNSKTSTAIRETRDAYAVCANRDKEESNFIHNGKSVYI